MSEILVILNPMARSERGHDRMKALGALGPKVVIATSTAPGEAREIAAQAVREGFHTVVAAGGDGTINEVVNGIAGSDVTLGVLPIGTMNVFASELGVSNKVREAWEIIQAGHTREIDLGRANNRHFVQLAGAGLDAQVVKETTTESKRELGPLAYVLSTAQVCGRKPPKLIVEADGESVEGSFVLLGNGRFYGGRLEFFRDARMDDGLLDVLIFGKTGHFDLAWYFGHILMKRHTDLSDVTYLQAKTVRVVSDEPVPVELDGELVSELPVTFTIAPRKLRVLVPPPSDAAGRRQFFS
jgi:YegS/Rv2252/BmrU family lipid kinase